MKNDNLSGPKRVLYVLAKGGKWATPHMAEGADLQANTAIKYVNALKAQGYPIGQEAVPDKPYNRYWLDMSMTDDQRQFNRFRSVLQDIDAVLPGYPDCREKEKLLIQRADLCVRLDLIELSAKHKKGVDGGPTN